jgi:hypothetical protein
MIYDFLSLSRWFFLALWRQMSSLSGILFTQTKQNLKNNLTQWRTETKQDSQLPLFQGNIIAYWLNETFSVWRTFWEEQSATDSLGLGNEMTLYLLWGPNDFSSSSMIMWKDKCNIGFCFSNARMSNNSLYLYGIIL